MTTIILGQIDKVSPTFLHQAVLLFIGVIGGAAGVASVIGIFLKRKRQIEPQPFVVTEATEFMPRRECRGLHTALDQALTDMRLVRARDAQEGNDSRKALYQQIEGVRKEMGEMERRLNADDEKRTQALHERINDILEAVGELRGRTTHE